MIHQARSHLGGHESDPLRIVAGCDLGQGYLFAKPLESEELGGLAALESGFADTIARARLAALGTADPIRSVASEGDTSPYADGVEHKRRRA